MQAKNAWLYVEQGCSSSLNCLSHSSICIFSTLGSALPDSAQHADKFSFLKKSPGNHKGVKSVCQSEVQLQLLSKLLAVQWQEAGSGWLWASWPATHKKQMNLSVGFQLFGT